ncbi:MAG: hypothetical protein ACJ72D_25850 [Marmoricola sp.]
MTTTPATPNVPAAIMGDLAFWTAASAVTLVVSGRVASSWGAPEPVVVGVAAGILGAGVAGMVLRSRLRGSVVLRIFGWTNLAMAPALLAVALLDVLGLTRAGNTALVLGAAVAALFGAWQVASGLTSRRRS